MPLEQSTFTYDATGNLATEATGAWANSTVTNKWNSAGLRSSLAIQQPASYFNASYTYDAARRLTNVTSGAGTFKYYYHPGLNSKTASTRLVQELMLPNTSYITNVYDGVVRLTDKSLKQGSGTMTNRHAYVYDAANERTQQTRTDGSYVTYYYDKAGQFYATTTTNSSGTEIAAERFGDLYDAAFNVLQRTNNTTLTAYAVDSQNQLTSYGGFGCSYDSNGNLITQTVASRNYTYDDENELLETDQSGNTRTDLTYDGRLRLRKRVESTWSGSTWVQSSETRYLYDGMLVVQERDGSNNPTVTYTRGIDLSGTFQGAGGIGGLLARSSTYSSGSWLTNHYYHADGNGKRHDAAGYESGDGGDV